MGDYIMKEIFSWTRVIVVVFHIVGLIGMIVPSFQPFFQLLTPFHLIVCTLILLVFHLEWNNQFVFFLLLSYLVGFLAEVMGVKTGFPFGNYEYSGVLGLQLWEVPLMIGVNWFLLVYITGSLLHGRMPYYVAAVIGALIMVLMDVLIEPVAVKLNFWQWENGEIPISNYIGWFGVALILQFFYHRLKFRKENPMSVVLLISLILFFAALNLLL
jgi:uncharacterized membrane protein